MLLHLARHFTGERWKIAGYSFLGLATAQMEAAALVLLVPFAQAIAEGSDRFEGSMGSVDISLDISSLALLSGVLLAGAFLGNLLSAWLTTRTVAEWEARRRLSVFTDYANADYATQRMERAGGLQVLSDYTGYGARALSSMIIALQAGLSVAVFLGVAFFLDFRAALALIVLGVLVSTLLRPVAQRVKPYSRRLAELQQQLGHELAESGSGARELRVFGAWPHMIDSLAQTLDRIARLRTRVGFLAAIVSPTYQYLGIGVVLAGLFAAKSFDLISVNVLGATALLLIRSLSYGQRVQSAYQTLSESAPFLERLEESEARYTAHAEPDAGGELEAVSTIACDAVTYSYDEGDLALDSVSLEIRRGEIVGIIGPSGSGKSTLSQMLLRLRSPQSGVVRVNGMAAEQFSLSSWSERVTLVPQDPVLFHGSVRDNIALFDPDVPMETIQSAARAAGVHSVIAGLPDGYDTQIGAAVHDLSGGQIQRIGIARALARDADVVVLDEPSSALDVESETIVVNTLKSLGDEKIVIIIAHRMSTLSICDRLIVMSDGRLEAEGTPAEVARDSAFYRQAVEAGTLDITGRA